MSRLKAKIAREGVTIYPGNGKAGIQVSGDMKSVVGRIPRIDERDAAAFESADLTRNTLRDRGDNEIKPKDSPKLKSDTNCKLSRKKVLQV
jgi:hypothetical protein